MLGRSHTTKKQQGHIFMFSFSKKDKNSQKNIKKNFIQYKSEACFLFDCTHLLHQTFLTFSNVKN
jgi:hypothetical protein